MNATGASTTRRRGVLVLVPCTLAIPLGASGCQAVLGIDGATDVCATSAPAPSSTVTCAHDETSGISFVQGVSANIGHQQSATVTLPHVTSGHAIIIAADAFPADPSYRLVVADDSTCYSPVVGPVAGVGQSYIYAAFDASGGDHVVQFTSIGAPPANLSVYLHEYAGIASFDRGSSASKEMGTPTAHLETRCEDELVFAFAVSPGVVTGVAGFSLRSNFASNVTADRPATATGTTVASATSDGSAWALLLAGFLAP